ncbi:hypothetical protein EI94DRAFT_1707390 [Lactarius quietus]|nr:hypothetical protein EI94DRAFT_1707390 [Lactarius quietus]
MASGPAVNMADARKNKKKKNSAGRDGTNETPLPPANEMDIFLPEDKETHAHEVDHNLHGKQTVPPPQLNPEQCQGNEDTTNPLPPLDLDVPMNPPRAVPGTPTTPTQNARANPTAQAPPILANNGLGLSMHAVTPPSPPSTPMMSSRLEEVENMNSQSGKHQTRNTIERYTPGPMPSSIQDSSPTSIFNHIDIDLIREWEKFPGGKLIAIPFDNEVTIPEAHEFIHNKILTAIAEILNAEEVSVAIPKPNEEVTRKSKTPRAFFIYNITMEQMATILKCEVWSSRAITFRVAPFAFTCPKFLFSIKALGTIAIKDIFPIIKRVWEGDKTKNHIDTLLDKVPPALRAQVSRDCKHLINTMNLAHLDAKGAGNMLDPCFNVYADCNAFKHDKTWSSLRTYLFNCAYISPIQGQARTEKIPFRCSCCHGVDHPRGLCVFPDTPGWNSPKRENVDSQQRRSSGHANFGLRTQRQRYTPY